MRYFGKSEKVAESLLNAFELGKIPAALSQVFIKRNGNRPCDAWSWSNQLITIMFGQTSDARGFRQWEKVGRKVKKGSRCFHILAPCIKKIEDKKTGEEEPRIIGFKSVPVFAIESTEVFNADLWAEHSADNEKADTFISELPLLNVAKSWGIEVKSYNGENASCLGRYQRNELYGTKNIALGVENLSTWFHELIHAAEHKLDRLNGSKVNKEIVAEFGGCVLLNCLGMETESDKGGAWDYIQSYAAGSSSKAMNLLSKLINRTCEAVNLILKEAEKLELSACHYI